MSAPVTDARPVDAVRAQLAELCGSDDEQEWAMLSPVLDAFVQGSTQRLDELVDAVARTSGAEVEFLSHRLKGSALTLGVSELAHACGRMEAEARAGQVDPTGHLVRALVREMKAAVATVEQVRAALPSDTTEPASTEPAPSTGR